MKARVEDVLRWTGGRLVNSDALGAAAGKIQVSAPARLDRSVSENIAFFFSREYQDQLLSAKPGILITGEPFVLPLQQSGLPLWKETAVIACRDPYLAMALLSEKFAVGNSHSAPESSDSGEKKIHPSAVVDASAEIGEGVEIGPQVVIEAGARVGEGTRVMPGCTVGPGASIGRHCVLFSGVHLYENVRIGDHVRIHSGTVIGSDGFGYAPVMEQGEESRPVRHQKIFHLGSVIIGNHVEIGANSCVDRGTIGDTVIEDHAKIDNLVQIAHNAFVGKGAIICGGTALAGRAEVHSFATVGGLTGISNAVKVGEGAKVGALSLVTKDVAPGSTAVGNPQREYRDHFKAHAMLSRLVQGKRKSKES